ncbi:cbs domain-containing protein [Leptolyngbya sp. Heron Island J]|uniref:hemolysin family protein n=1 Tax=Leptolyngbya sp. Heron Island J TaxID=1385935 RepID=UPI0003B9EEA4|nr:hemolysin family protein [Leptolyngbya sp. Heron Island J]ESA34830.1 cbs domain-containing protein [Leptolyngbya sp. Heron Island J]
MAVQDLVSDSELPISAAGVMVRLLTIGALIILNAFFVAAEFSIVSVRRSRINQLASVGDIQAQTVQSLQRSIDRLLPTTQIGITLASLALGWIGEDTLALLLHGWLRQLPIPTSVVSHGIALMIAFWSLAYLQIVLGELVPKSLALSYSEQTSRLLGPVSLTVARLFSPVVWVLNCSTQGLLKLVGLQEQRQADGQLTSDELQMIISTPTAVLDLDQEEREILNNVFETRDFTVEDIMVPRTQIVALDDTATWQDLLNIVVETGYSQFPLIGDSLDNISGILDFKSMAQPMAQGQLTFTTPVSTWMKAARVVPTDLPLSDLLSRMQQLNHSMMIVVDDYGGTAGLVTWADVTAELIGDEDGIAPGDIVYLDDQSVLLPAQMEIDIVNKQFALSLPTTEDYQTLAGFVIHALQKIPEAGEQLHYSDDLMFTVKTVKGPKLEQIQITRHHGPLRRRIPRRQPGN